MISHESVRGQKLRPPLADLYGHHLATHPPDGKAEIGTINTSHPSSDATPRLADADMARPTTIDVVGITLVFSVLFSPPTSLHLRYTSFFYALSHFALRPPRRLPCAGFPLCSGVSAMHW